MRDGLRELRELAISGNVHEHVVFGSLSYEEKTGSLSIINLQDGEAGQEQHSGGFLFLKPLALHYTNHVHLCKLTKLVSSERDVTSLRWDFDYENDGAVLSERAVLRYVAGFR